MHSDGQGLFLPRVRVKTKEVEVRLFLRGSGLGVGKSKWLIMFIRAIFHCEHIIREGYAIEKVYVNLVYNKG